MIENYVEIVRREDQRVVRRMGPHSYRTADLIRRGAEINLHHELFFVRLVTEDKQEPPPS